ncbi:MAG: hypothetical protein KF799_12085 [Bdellovibrionales bacterium]|nr:hypothetical protein [Bdellovibrionales bacterium]
MAFEGLQENLKERWAELSAKVQESSAFNTLRERFESQTPPVQKAIVIGGAALAALFLLSFPLGYLSTASDNMMQFEENRQMIQGLLRASRISKEASPLPPPLDPGMLRSQVERVLREKQLVPEQMGEMAPLPGTPANAALAPASVVQNGLAAQIKQLTLNQIVDIANSFQNQGPGTKLIGFDIVQTAGQTHYYDLILRVVNFGLPAVADSGPPGPGGGTGNRPPSRGAPPPADGGDEE